MRYTTFESPFGLMAVLGSDAGLRRIFLPRKAPSELHGEILRCAPEATEDGHAFAGLVERLQRYFAGEPVEFPDALDLSRSSPFQRAVYAAVQAVPYGATATYAEIARRIGRPGAWRAVGRANATNPWPIIVPCHRLIGSDGGLRGYGGGIDMKRTLLALERASRTPAAFPAGTEG